MPEAPIRISVTRLAEFSCRTGDLMPPGVAAPSSREGIRTHQKIQRQALETARCESAERCGGISENTEPDSAGPDDEAGVSVETTLSCLCTVESTCVELVGRVDIVDLNRRRLTEIKTTLVPAEHLPEGQRDLQWAQLLLYGFIFLTSTESKSLNAEPLELELLHVNIRADSKTSEVRQLSREALTLHATTALIQFVRWLQRVEERRDRLKLSATSLKFPHGEFRPGQRHMAAAVYRAARDGQALMCEAPTGIGKTISAMFPAGKMLGESTINQVVYLTAKVAGRLSALQSLNQMHDAGLQISGIQIRAKQATCFCSNGRCERDDSGRCPMTLGFFDRLPAARDELMALGIIEDCQLDEIAWQHQLCPFELALQMLPWMHVVIADFNYVFDPLVRLPHFSESRSDALLLVDEAHNLVDRSRSMFSAQLSRIRCQDEATACRESHPMVSRSLDRVARALLTHANQLDTAESIGAEVIGSIAKVASDAVESIVSAMGDGLPVSEDTGELFRALCRYVAINELFRDKHRCISRHYKVGRRREVDVTLYCLDASDALNKQYQRFRSTVLFSATLRPSQFYRDTLGLPTDTARIQLSSPFDPHRSYRAVADWVDTRYRKREHSLEALVSLIKSVSGGKRGNYLIFFPSYAYLNLAYQAFTQDSPDVETWRQTHEQSKTEQQRLLRKLDEPGHRIGFAILGGVFGEGIDYVGNKLIGVIIISTGLPGINTQTQLVADHYREQGHDGYDFAYRYPGFTRVLQTAGRLIRTETDVGVVVLVDDRFNQSFYQALYPEEWQIQRPYDEHRLAGDINSFWNAMLELPQTK